MSSSKSFRFVADAKTAFLLHQRVLKENRCISDLVRRAVQQYLAIDPADEPDIDAARIESAKGSRATAVYLSQPIAAAIEQLATKQDRSRSWIVRTLLRNALRERNLLPSLSAPTSAANDIV